MAAGLIWSVSTRSTRPSIGANLDRCIMAARAVGLPVLVRTATASPEHILNALDCGADGVLLPHIRNAREAAATALAA